MQTLQDIALGLRDKGFSVIPVKENKAPAIPAWTEYQKRLPTPEEIRAWTWNGIGIICGAVSGNLVCVDVDTKNDQSGSLLRDLIATVNAVDPRLLPRVIVEETVNHGRHILFKSSSPIPTKDLALESDRKVIIETRGEGAYFVCAPTTGYKLTQGRIEDTPLLDDKDVAVILSSCESMNRYAPEPVVHHPTQTGSRITPLDDYDAKTGTEAVANMLVGRGWKIITRRGDVYSLCRPDKQERAVSATLGHIPGKLYVFSSSTEFEQRRAYKPSQVYAFLYYGGDFSAAARDLYQQGFGERVETRKKKSQKDTSPVVVEPSTEDAIAVVRVADLQGRVEALWERGMDKGLSTGWANLDGFFRVVKGQLNILTGIPSHGKSEVMDNLLYNFAKLHGWKCLIFSPENYPLELHVRKLAEKVMKRNFANASGKAPFEDVREALEWLNEHFFFVNVGEADIDLDSILALAGAGDYDAVLIDPWNEIGGSRPKDMNGHEYIGVCLRRIRKFARKKKVSFWIAAHPVKQYKDKNGETPVPNMYDIDGSSHWYNKADNGFCVNRNFLEGSTELHVLKVKFRYYGQPGVAKFRYQQDGGVLIPWSVHDDFHMPEEQTPPRMYWDDK